MPLHVHHNPRKLNVRKGDTVQVISGKDRGLKGKVIQAYPDSNKVLVEGANRIKRHTRVTRTQRGAQSGGIITQEAPVHVSNVQVVCPGCDKPSRRRAPPQPTRTAAPSGSAAAATDI